MRIQRTDRGQVTRLVLSGELDAFEGRELAECADALIEDRKALIALDVAGLDFIDSTGVAILVSLYKRARRYGGVVVVERARDQPLAIFQLLRLDRVFVRPAPAADLASVA